MTRLVTAAGWVISLGLFCLGLYGLAQLITDIIEELLH